jgi:hypothetical protein
VAIHNSRKRLRLLLRRGRLRTARCFKSCIRTKAAQLGPPFLCSLLGRHERQRPGRPCGVVVRRRRRSRQNPVHAPPKSSVTTHSIPHTRTCARFQRMEALYEISDPSLHLALSVLRRVP